MWLTHFFLVWNTSQQFLFKVGQHAKKFIIMVVWIMSIYIAKMANHWNCKSWSLIKLILYKFEILRFLQDQNDLNSTYHKSPFLHDILVTQLLFKKACWVRSYTLTNIKKRFHIWKSIKVVKELFRLNLSLILILGL